MYSSLNGERLVDKFTKLDQNGETTFSATDLVPLSPVNAVAYGGFMIAQALVAARKAMPATFLPHSIHCYFMNAGDTTKPMQYEVETLRDGASFLTRSIKTKQDDENIASIMMSFCKNDVNGISHQDKFPNVKPPEEVPSAKDAIKVELNKNSLTIAMRKRLQLRANAPETFAMKPCKPEVHFRTAPHPSTAHDYCWVKSNDSIGANQLLQSCMACYITDMLLVPTVIAPHVGTFEEGYSLSLDHTMWFHSQDYKIDQWMLYETWSTKAGGGRGFAMGRLWTRDGKLVISASQEIFIIGAKK